MSANGGGINARKIAAEKAVENITEGMIVGLGSGSTASYAIQKIGERVKEGLKIKGVPSSLKSETLARELQIPLIADEDIDVIDIAIDGADEVDRKGNLIKGGGGSLWREKILDFASKKFYVIVDESKVVETLGKSAVPVEVLPFAVALTIKHLKGLGCTPVIRKAEKDPFISDNGNLIVDCKFGNIDDPAWLDVKIKMIPGVVETGLFSNKIVTSIYVGYASGEVRQIFP